MEENRDDSEALLKKLSNPSTVHALNNLVDRLTELHETGVMDSFFQTVQAITFMKDGLTDPLVSKNAAMAADLMEVASEAASPEVLESLREMKKIHRSGNIKDLFDLTNSASFLLNSTTDKMLERNAAILGELYNIANEAADPDVAEAIRELKNLQKSGNLKILAQASDMVAFMSHAVTDSMVQRIATFASTFVEEVSTPHISDILRSTNKCLSRTVQQFAEQPPKPGLKNLLAVMRDPEVQVGIIFMATLAKNMQQCMLETYTGAERE